MKREMAELEAALPADGLAEPVVPPVDSEGQTPGDKGGVEPMMGIPPDACMPPHTSNDGIGQEDLETLPGLPQEPPHQASLCF